jgi:hypothetical protein
MKTKAREAWFRRAFLWGSMPIHWKGYLVLVGVLPVVGIGITGLAFAQQRHPILATACLGVAFCCAVAVILVAELHMERK